ncbi:hypothetical protein CVT26_014842 [Gymnopilus dilepis]|uniref:Uncharacterized protein n=1 Tax=Gymnopilus dilepis TaxID=231916 RepID=A0A409XWY0_9AGAR|nr:hypothetical protein CVT26_014842 [Gymnopilus dilepis]
MPIKAVRLATSSLLPSPGELQACWELCRLHNNIGFWVVWLPTAWSIFMAYHVQKEVSASMAVARALLYVPLCFGIKSLIMTIDDILDADVDGLVERTRGRPLPRGAISTRRAWFFFFGQVLVGIGLAMYFLGATAFRWTNLAPLPLGVMFNVGIFMGWADLTPNEKELPMNVLVPMYIGACLWTFTYETIYQHQDKVDDIKIGLHSPALLLGRRTIPVCTATAVGFFVLISYAGFLNQQGIFYFAGVALAFARLIYFLLRVDIDKPQDCRDFFLDTITVGQIILSGIVLDAFFSRVLSGTAL